MPRPALDYHRDLGLAAPLASEAARERLDSAQQEIVAGSDAEALPILTALRNELGALLPAHDDYDHPVARAYDGVRDALHALEFPAHRGTAVRHLGGVREQLDRWERMP